VSTKKKMRLSWGLPLYVLLPIVLGACGTEIGNPKKPDPTPVQGSIFLTDGTAAAGIISSLFEEVASSGAEAVEAAGSEAALGFSLAADGDDRKCVAGADGTVTVTRAFSGQSSAEKKRKHKTFVARVSGTAAVNHVYTKPESTLACNGAGTNIRLGLAGFFGVTVATTYDRVLQKTLTVKETGDVLWARDDSAKGTRTWIVNKIDGLVGNSFGLETRESRVATRVQSVPLKNGETLSVSSEVGTTAGEPLVVHSDFNRGGNSLQSRTIVSGTTYSVQPNDSRIETTFNAVKYTPAGGCVPEAGSIDGKIFAAGETTPTRTYRVVFNDDGMQVTFDNGEVVVTQPEHCPIE